MGKSIMVKLPPHAKELAEDVIEIVTAYAAGLNFPEGVMSLLIGNTLDRSWH